MHAGRRRVPDRWDVPPGYLAGSGFHCFHGGVMNARDTYRMFYRIKRLHMSPVRAALISVWYAIKPTKF
jgi:hypothetical protein